MKKILFFVMVFLASFIFTSCIEIVQTIDFLDGNYKIGYRLTISKVVFAMSGEEPSTLFDGVDFSDFPKGIKITPIDTSLDIGLGFDAEINPKTNTEEKELLPKVLKDGRIEIPLIGEDKITEQTDSTNDDSEAFAKAMLSSAKWHVYVSKKVVPSISKVYLENKYGTQNVEFFKVGDVYVINVPIVLIENGIKLIIEK